MIRITPSASGSKPLFAPRSWARKKDDAPASRQSSDGLPFRARRFKSEASSPSKNGGGLPSEHRANYDGILMGRFQNFKHFLNVREEHASAPDKSRRKSARCWDETARRSLKDCSLPLLNLHALKGRPHWIVLDEAHHLFSGPRTAGQKAVFDPLGRGYSDHGASVPGSPSSPELGRPDPRRNRRGPAGDDTGHQPNTRPEPPPLLPPTPG